MFLRCSPRTPWFRIFLLAAALLSFSGCGREPLYQSQSYVFGTLVDISIYGEPEARAKAHTAHIQREFQRLHDQLYAWQAGSELSRLNAAFAAGRSAPVSAELAGILADATLYSAASHGLFNPAIGHLIQAWGFQRDDFTPIRPDPQKIRALVYANPQMTDLRIEAGVIASRNPAVRLDLGGYAKGWALDLAAEYLGREQVPGALVNIGGNIIAVGRRGDRPWRVGIQHPRQPGPLATLDLPDGWAIGTSGDYQRYFEMNGLRFCHILDPRTGTPVQGVQAVTALIPPGPQAGTLSDVGTKPVFIRGLSGWREAARAIGVQHVLLIDGQGRIHVTQALRQRLKFTDPNVRPEILP
jgi:thiamine biosynthesis lipoprotein